MSSSQSPGDAVRPGRPARSLRRILASAVLAFEGLVVVFAALVAMALTSLGKGPSLIAGAVLAVSCFVAAALLRTPVGVGLGWVLQVALIATGFWVPTMFFLGALFAALWVTALRVGDRIDREKAAYAAASAGQQQPGPAPSGPASSPA